MGEDIAPLVGATLLYGHVDATKAEGLDRIVFDGYVEGLREAGWRGDERAVRLGYAAASALRYGTVYTDYLVSVLRGDIQLPWRLGRSMEEVIGRIAPLMCLLHRLGDEARQLMGEL